MLRGAKLSLLCLSLANVDSLYLCPAASNSQCSMLQHNLHIDSSDDSLQMDSEISADHCNCSNTHIGGLLSQSPVTLIGDPLLQRAETVKRRFSEQITWVVVSEHMDGMLEATLACNSHHVDRVIVITSPEDNATRRVCSKASDKVSCHITDSLHRNGDPFNKGRALHELQTILHGNPTMRDHLILLMDNDICMPEGLWAAIPAQPQNDVLYSVPNRCIYDTPQEASQGKPTSVHESQYSTIGFFQLYKVSPQSPLYATEYPTAAQSDLLFANLFERVVHLHGHVHHLGTTNHWSGFHGQSAEWSEVRVPISNHCPCCKPMSDHFAQT